MLRNHPRRASPAAALATGFTLLLFASPAFSAQWTDRGGQTDNAYSVDFPAGSRWEPCRTCYLTVTGFIESVNKPSKYTANEDAEPNRPNDMPEFDMIRKYDQHVIPALARWYESQFMVVRTNEPLNASGVLPDTAAYRQYRNQVFNNCDLLLVSKWKENHHCTGGGRTQDKYGRSNVVVMTCGPDNIGWEYAEMKPENRFVNTDKEYVGTMGVAWHEFNHGMFGSFSITKSDTRSFYNHAQGMGSYFLDNTIRTPPDYWPRPSFVQHFMKNLPAGTRVEKPFVGGQGLYYVNSPRVLEMVRYWSNCPTLKGYPLKNSAETPRNEYVFSHHANFGGNWGDVNCYGRDGMVSAMSYALYEDSGLWKINWTNVNFDNVNIALRPNQNMTRMMTEHFKTGCGFFEEPWPFLRGDDDASSTVSSVNEKRYHEPTPGWGQMLCNRAAYGGTKMKTTRHYCSADRTSKAICGRRQDVDEWEEGGWGWSEYGNTGWEDELANPFLAARIMVPTTRLDGENNVEGSSATPGTCLDAGSQNAARYGESASETSRCFRGTIEPEGETPWSNSFESAFCFEHRCTAGNLIEFQVNSVWYTCPELGGEVEIAGFSGHVTCPHQMLICPANCPGDCNGRGTCNRRTGICMCDETLVNSSYVGIGCEQEWKTYWPSEYPYDGLFKPVEIKLRDLPHFDASDNLAIIAAVLAALGVEEGDVELDVSSFRFEVESEHLLPGVTQADFDAEVNNANPYLRYNRYEGMIVGRLNSNSRYSGELRIDDVKVGQPRTQARRRLLSGYVVPFTVYPPTMEGARSAQEVKARCANPGTFSNIAETFGELVLNSPPVMSATITVTIGASDPDVIAQVNAALADRDAFDAKVQREAESRGMYYVPPKKGLEPGAIAGIAVGCVVVVGLAAVAAFLFMKKGGKVGQAPSGAKKPSGTRGAKSPPGRGNNKVTPKR